jgi:hypothetical protein
MGTTSATTRFCIVALAALSPALPLSVDTGSLAAIPDGVRAAACGQTEPRAATRSALLLFMHGGGFDVGR